MFYSGDGKHKREGSCVGTKGFRAPEVRPCCHFSSLAIFHAIIDATLCDPNTIYMECRHRECRF